MQNNRLQIIVKVFALLIISFNATALDLSVSNYTISPGTQINTNQNFSISLDITSVDDLSGDNSTSPRVVIDMDGSITPSNILAAATVNSFTAGWVNMSEQPGVLIFDIDLSGSPLLVGQTISFQVDLTSGSSANQLEAITVQTFDFLIADSNTADNFAATNVQVNGAPPDLDFNDSITLTDYNATQNQQQPVTVDFKIDNLGGEASAGASMSVSYDDINLIYQSASSVVPLGWTCTQSTGLVDCFTSDPVSAGAAIPFALDFSVTNAGTFSLNGSLFDFGGTETNTANNSISTNINVTAGNPDLEVTIISPATLPVTVPTGSVTATPFEFKVKNIGDTTFLTNDVDFFISNDPNFVIANVQSISTDWSCSPQPGGFQCLNTGIDVIPNAQFNFTGEITAYPATPGLYSNVVMGEVADLTGTEILLSNNSKVIAVEIADAETDLRLTKFVKDGNGNLITDVNLNENFFYHIHVDNLSTTAATNAGVNDPLPLGVQFVSNVSSGSWNCVADPFIDSNNSQGVSCSHPSIPASSPNFVDVIKLEVVGLTTGIKENTALAFSDEPDSNPFDNDNFSSPATVSVNAVAIDPDIDVTKTIQSGVIMGGNGLEAPQNGTVVYKILSANITSGSVNGDNVQITDTLPAGVTYVSHNELGPNFVCSPFDTINNKLVCTAGSLPFTTAEDGVEITVEVTGSIGTSVVNTASVTATNDVNTANNSSTSDSFTIIQGGLPEVDMSITKSAIDINGAAINSVIRNDAFKYELLIENLGPNDAPGGSVKITDTLPAEVIFATPFTYSGNWTCVINNGNQLACDNDSLISGGTGKENLTFDVVAQTAGLSVMNTANVDAVVPAVFIDNIPSNNNSTATIDIIEGSSEINISKQVQGGITATSGSGATNEFAIGDTVFYQISATNNSAAISYQDLIIKDSLPANVIFTSVNATQGFICNYDQTNHEVVCESSAANPLPAGQTVDIDINAEASLSGLGIINTANASSIQNGDNVFSNQAIIDIVDPGQNPTTTVSILKQALSNNIPVSQISRGDSFVYRIDINNTGTENALNVALADLMPSDVIVNSVTGADWSCNNTGQQYNCNYALSLPPGANTFIEFDVTNDDASVISQLVNSASVSGSNFTSLTAQNNLLVTDVSANVNISQTPNPVIENSVFDLVIEVTNTGSENLQNVQVVNTLPSGFSYASPDLKVNSSTCTISGLVMTCNFDLSVITGVTDTITIPVLAIEVADPNVSYVNSTIVSGSNLALPIAKNTIINVNQINSLSDDISISKTASLVSVSPGSDFQYNLSVSNLGTLTAQNVVVTDNLPANITLNSIDAVGWSCSGTSQIICTLAALNPSSVSDVILNVTAPAETGVVTNMAEVTMIAPDLNPANNISQVSVSVETGTNPPPVAESADLIITKSASVSQITSGDDLQWNIELLNDGPDSAQNIVLTDLLPQGFDATSVQSSSGDCQISANDVVCNIISMDNQEIVSVTIFGNVTLNSGILENTVSVLADTEDPDLSNNSDAAEVNVTPPVNVSDADLSVTLNTDESIIQGSLFDFTIDVKNEGPDASNKPSLDVALTGIIDHVSVAENADWSCNISELIISCEYNAAAMPASSQSLLTIAVQTTQEVNEPENITINSSVTSTTTDSDSSNNNASTVISVSSSTPTEQEIVSAMGAALAGRGNQQIFRAIQNVASYCERSYFTALEGMCDSLYQTALNGDGETIENVMKQITPNEIIGQSTSVAEIATTQYRNVGARLAQIRNGGGAGFSTAGLNARYGSGSIPLGMLSYLNQTEEESKSVSSVNNDFISPWGVFVNGTISMGERDATGRELGFDFDTYGITAGIDYRINSNKVVGVAVGYASFDSKVEDKAQLKSTGVTLTGYGSFNVGDNFYMDARISMAKPEFDQSREIDFTLGDVNVQRTASGTTNATQYTAAMSAGYNFNTNSWNITPNASIRYVKTTIDGFSETGAGAFNFRYSDQEIESLLWSAGIRITKAISLKNGVITPQFDFDYNYESLNDAEDIRAWFIQAPSDEVFIIETDSPDRTFGSAGLGMVYVSSNGKQAYINYRSILGLDGFSRGTFNLGARFEF